MPLAPSGSRWSWLAPLGIAGAVAVVFARSIGHGLVFFDDDQLLVWVRAFRGTGPDQLRWMFSNAVLGHYVPVTWLSFAIDYRLWGVQPDGYHLTNVLLHAVNAALVAVVATRLVARATGWPAGRAWLAAGLAALSWALHPLRVEAVSWITGRRDVLAATFLLLALWMYLRAQDPATGGRWRWLGAATGMYALAIGAKEVVMVFPAALILLEVYPSRRLPPDPLRWTGRACRQVWRDLLPLFGVAALGAVAGYSAAHHVPVRVLGPGEWLGQLAVTVWFHVWKTVLPLGLSPLYELRDRLDWTAPIWGRAVFGMAISGAAAGMWRHWPAGLVAWGWYLAFLAPVTAPLHNGPQLTADRYGYLPTLGLFVLAGAGAVQLLGSRREGRSRGRGPGRWRALLVAAGAGAALVASAGLTWRQQAIWRDGGQLWAAALRATPTCAQCRVYRGNWLANDARYEEAIAEYRRALELDPQVQAREYMGLALVRLGRAQDALPQYEAALAASPARVSLRVGYARALVAAGRRAQAVALLEAAGAHGTAAALVDYFRALTDREPAAAVARLGLVQAYARVGDLTRARAAHARLAQLDPELARLAALRLPPGATTPVPAGPALSPGGRGGDA